MPDTADVGQREKWFDPASFPGASAKPISVPGNIYESLPNYNGIVWYSCGFKSNPSASTDLRYFLRFGAVQYSCEVWLNGSSVGTHEGAGSPFELEVTNALVSGAENRLIVRIFSPVSFFRRGGYPIAFDMGGILQHVVLAAQPKVRIESVFARPSIRDARILIEVGLENSRPGVADLVLTTIVRDRQSGRIVSRISGPTKVESGHSTSSVSAAIAAPHLWNLDDPFLYSVAVTAESSERADEYVVPRVGFREFRINSAGFFELNRKRIFIKSTHHNVYDPVSIQGTPRDMTYLARDAKLLKEAGFNMMRFICYTALPEQLELADELGLLIYNEHQASWMLQDVSKFAIDLPAVIKRDRNHPSLVIWGLLNEEANPEIYRAANQFLPVLRKIDDTRLVLVSSGRWDAELKNGSASNPGSAIWNVMLGGEDPLSPQPTGKLATVGPRGQGGFTDGSGDAHIYQAFPQSQEFLSDFARFAEYTKPVFVSEAGNGSAFDPFGERRKMQQAHAASDAHAFRSWIDPQIKAIEASWRTFGLDRVYPNMDTFFADSAKVAAQQRAQFFSALRSNPKINGFSLTSMMDAWGAGEGVMDTFRAYKPDHLKVLQDGWSKLRWCLFVNPTTPYVDGAPLHVRAVLANDNVLPAGKHSARLKIVGAGGEMWSRSLSFVVPSGSNPPLAYPILDEDIATRMPKEGEYVLTASLEDGETAGADSLAFKIFARDQHATLQGLTITTLEVPRAVQDLLVSRGATLRGYDENRSIEPGTILIGDFASNDPEVWQRLYGRVARGANAVFLSSKVFSAMGDPNHWLPLEPKGRQKLEASDGESELYHTDYICKPHVITAGLPSGIMSPTVFGQLLATPARFISTAIPDETVVVSLRNTYQSSEVGYTIGVFNHHHGKIVLNSFNLMAHVGTPVADRLIINLARYAGDNAAVTPSPLPQGYADELTKLGITPSR